MFPAIHGILGGGGVAPPVENTRTNSLVIRPTSVDRQLTSIRSGSPNNNLGRFPEFFSGGGSSETWRSLIKFNLDEIPAGATITKARIMLYMDSAGDTASRTIGFHRSLVEWHGGFSNNLVPSTTDVPASTWNHRIYDTTTWSTAGGASSTEWAATATDSVVIGNIINRFYEWDVASDVQDFVNGTVQNYGWWIINADEGVSNSFRRFALTGTHYTDTRPVLFITYEIGSTGTWYNPDWSFRKEITIDHNYVDDELINFPLLVDLNADSNVTSAAQANYGDLVFTASDGVTKLEHELVGRSGVVTNNGVWTFYPGFRAVRHVGTKDQTYVGWVNVAGDVLIAAYNHGTNEWVGPTILHAALIADDHVAPTVLIRNDGHIMAFYSRSHNHIKMRISSNPEDISAFDAVVEVGSGAGLSGISYPIAFQLSAESNKIFLFFTTNGTNRELRFMTSTDGGSTWSSPTNLYDRAAAIYFHACQNGNSRIDFLVSSNHPAHGSGGLYHFYYEDGKYYKSDDTEITATLPLDSSDLTEIHSADGTRPWNWGISVGGSGSPAIVYVNYPDGTTLGEHRYRYARWDGTEWTSIAVASAGRDISLANREYSGGIAISADNTDVIYASVPINGVLNIIKYTRSGSSFVESQRLTYDSAYNNIRPMTVVNAHADLPLLWMSGPYNTYTNYRTSIMSPLRGRQAKAWVRVPSVSDASNTIIYCYYGNSDATPQARPEMVWRDVYDVVWHGHTEYRNATRTTYPIIFGEQQQSSSINTDGVVYKALEFNPTTANNELRLFQYTNMRAWAAITTEIIVNRHATLGGTAHAPLSNWSASGAGIFQRIIKADGQYRGFLRTASGQIGGAFTGTVAAATTTYIAQRYDSANGFQLFLNKTLDATTYGVGSGTLANVNSANLAVGGDGTSDRLYGWLEEMRISSNRKSAAWLNFVYDNIFNNGDTIAIGTEETP
jgi:hypothetical protein